MNIGWEASRLTRRASFRLWQRHRAVCWVRGRVDYWRASRSVLFWHLPHTGPEFSCEEQRGTAVRLLLLLVFLSSNWHCAVHLWARRAEVDPDVSAFWVTPRSAHGKTRTEMPWTQGSCRDISFLCFFPDSESVLPLVSDTRNLYSHQTFK